MDIISRKYINEGFNSKAYIINDDYILLDGVNQNSYKNYQKYVNVINQISNVKSLEIPRIIELIEPCEEYPNGALIYKMIKGHTFRKEHIEIVNLDNIAKKLAEFMDELYEIRVDFDKDEYIKNELEITEQSVIELKEYLSESNYEKILSWFNEYKNYLLTFNDYHFIHGDLWYENYILNDNNELVGIVDFEGSGMGDPAYDIAALYYLGTGFINKVLSLKKFIDNKNDFGFIAKINNKIVGFAFGYILLKPDGRKVFYLDAIDVMPDFQGKGYGTGLISFARDYAKTIDCYEMFLITNRSNISACKCYEKAGGINDADDEVVYVYDFREEN